MGLNMDFNTRPVMGWSLRITAKVTVAAGEGLLVVLNIVPVRKG